MVHDHRSLRERNRNDVANRCNHISISFWCKQSEHREDYQAFHNLPVPLLLALRILHLFWYLHDCELAGQRKKDAIVYVLGGSWSMALLLGTLLR